MPRIVLISILALCFACSGTTTSETTVARKLPVKAPFTDLDTLATNDWWNRAPNPIIDLKVPREEVIAFGIYTVSRGVLKLSAQLFPLYAEETR